MNKYEGLFILEAAAKEDTTKGVIEKIQKDIEQAGGRVETVQKMDQRAFARIAGKRSAGYYVNFVFQAPPKTIAELNAKFHLDSDIIRWQFVRAEVVVWTKRKKRDVTAKAEPAAARK